MATLLVDTREQKWDHVRDGFDRLGVTYAKSKLYVGDYAWADRQSIVVDRKQDMNEVYSNLVSQHARFRAELQRAQEANVHLIVLVEQSGISTLADVAKWENPREEKWHMLHSAHERGKLLYRDIPTRPPVSSDRIMNIMQSMADKYGVEWRFCNKEDTAVAILSLLKEESHVSLRL